mmetsp:Transcript_5999/g.8016  ORF Transcript_5999/g.8016 Transcript_5999/m.8016 type:complete len:434 (-) Transcript_5999:197-1498(-)|eukprot:CAMPEP_0116074160 /NCGR_PEP_ID=MMETSP0322-20121206/15760_1 /TAXON_ID=163516 /ORGANISM="Leptocylindrus danicus var. apora, Strain B651" /LENGTH=433 /DNA_ID=CAMNT_0003563747 /DNA_START=219 /DNA_END=1520 /DNA_ORIENTATION=-
MTRKSGRHTKSHIYSAVEVDFHCDEAKKFLTKSSKVDPENWGTPGFMTKEMYTSFVTLREYFRKRDADYRSAVMCFGEEEEETYALCRWLRARKFDVEETLVLIDDGIAERKEAVKHDFYTDPNAAIGAPFSSYIELYPQLYHGHAKNGCPLFISKPGLINIHAVDCITTLNGLIKLHWHVMHHDFRKRLLEQKASMGRSFTKFACFCILDLDGLSTSSITRKVMEIIKCQSRIDNVCYVETLSKMLIINAPVSFSMTWKVIKTFVDARTQNKIEIYSNQKKATARILELCEAKYVPSDYGGTAKNSHDILLDQTCASDIIRQEMKLVHLRSYETFPVKINAGERLEVVVYTKATGGTKVTILNKKKSTIAQETVIHTSTHSAGTDDFEHQYPTQVELTSNAVGPDHINIRFDSLTSRLHSDYYLLSLRFFKH